MLPHLSCLFSVLEQETAVAAFLKPVDHAVMKVIGQKAPPLKTLLNRAGSVPTDEAVHVLYMHDAFADEEFQAVVNSDLAYSILSFLSVFAYATYHTRSLLMAGTGMFISSISYPIALLIYRGVFKVCAVPATAVLVL